MGLHIHVSEIRTALEEIIESLFKIPRADIRSKSMRSLGEQAQEIREAIQSDIITVHLLSDIVTFALEEVVLHAKAIDALGASKASLLHARYIEEVSTLLKFIFHDTQRYEEFSWRWKSFSVVHSIKNRLLNLKMPIDENMQNWIDQNIHLLKKHIDPRFDRNSQKSIKKWVKYNNWLYPITLNKIFETAGRKESYQSREYDLNSNAVHFSPFLSSQYLEMELPHYTYIEAATDPMPNKHVLEFCRACLAVVSNRDNLRIFHAKIVYLELYKMIEKKPQSYLDMAHKNEGFALLTEFLLSRNWTIERAIDIVLGHAPEDPLVIRVGG